MFVALALVSSAASAKDFSIWAQTEETARALVDKGYQVKSVFVEVEAKGLVEIGYLQKEGSIFRCRLGRNETVKFMYYCDELREPQ